MIKSKLIHLAGLLLSLTCVCGMCSKEDQPNIDPGKDTSPAGKMAGTFNGMGKKMPGGIFLGNFNGCVTPPGWENNFQVGSSSATIAKLTDTTIAISLSGGVLSSTTYSNIRVTENGTMIDFLIGNYDSYTNLLLLSVKDGGSYITTNACLQGLPYYSGWSALSNGIYGYTTLGHIDFSGTKQ